MVSHSRRRPKAKLNRIQTKSVHKPNPSPRPPPSPSPTTQLHDVNDSPTPPSSALSASTKVSSRINYVPHHRNYLFELLNLPPPIVVVGTHHRHYYHQDCCPSPGAETNTNVASNYGNYMNNNNNNNNLEKADEVIKQSDTEIKEKRRLPFDLLLDFDELTLDDRKSSTVDKRELRENSRRTAEEASDEEDMSKRWRTDQMQRLRTMRNNIMEHIYAYVTTKTRSRRPRKSRKNSHLLLGRSFPLLKTDQRRERDRGNPESKSSHVSADHGRGNAGGMHPH